MTTFQAIIEGALARASKAEKQILRTNAHLDNAVSHAKKNGIPDIAVSPTQGQFLANLCKLSQAKSVLEVGTLGGYSTIWFAESVPGIKVTSIEFNPKHRDVALENTIGQGLDNVEIHLGAALDILPKIAEEGKIFDFVFIDADWANQAKYFDWAVKLTRKGGCVYVDNAIRQLTESDAKEDPAGWALIDHVKADDRVTPTIIPTLSTHKTEADAYVDGFVLAIVK